MRLGNLVGAGIALSAPLLGGCSYQPTVAGAPKPEFAADLGACRDTAEKAAHHRVISHGYYYFSYPVSYPLIERSELRRCLKDKGYSLG